MIPALIHQIWIGPSPIAERERHWCAETARLNPGWHHVLHGNEALERFAQDPYLRAMLSKGDKWAYVGDRLRVLLLREQGGVYIDADAEPVRPLESISVWHMPHVDFVAGLRSPHRKDVALHRAIPIVDNTFMASTPNGRMIRLIEDLWRPDQVMGHNHAINGHRTGLCILSHANWTTVLLGHRYIYCEERFPESVILHDCHNLASWVQTPNTSPRIAHAAHS